MLQERVVNGQITVYTSSRSLLNATIIEYENELICVDTLLFAEESRELAGIILQRGKPLSYIINTHWHSDHCFGNRYVKQDETLIISHEDYWGTLTSERTLLRKQSVQEVEKYRIPKPDITFTGELQLPALDIHCFYTPGHSPDAIAILHVSSGILIAGDTVLHGPEGKMAVPYFYWGDPHMYLSSLLLLQTLDPRLIIPGHGEPCNPSILQEHIDYLSNFVHLTEEFQRKYPNLGEREKVLLSIRELPINACVQGKGREDFWVPKMHELNLEKYFNSEGKE